MRAPKEYTDIQAARHATFSAAIKGKSAHRVAKALNKICPGIDYRGSTIRHMREMYCIDELSHVTGAQLREVLSDK